MTKPRMSVTTDGFVNFVSRIGVGGDKASYGTYTVNAGAMLDLEAAYRTTWLRKIVDIPPFDEVREWRAWTGANPAQVTSLDNEEKRLGIRGKVFEARVLARKDGGSAIVLGVGDADPMQPLDVASIGKSALAYVTVLTRWDITPGERDNNPLSPTFGEPVYYTMANTIGTRIHPSRVVRFIGNPIRSPFFWDGWGDSIWIELRDAVRHSDQISAGISAMVDEAKVDVVRLKGLANNLATTQGESALLARWQAAATLKSISNTLLLDGEDEYDQKTLSFDGLPDVLDRALMVMAGKADIPATRLLGRSPQGLNATGDSDTRNYYDRIRAYQQTSLQPTLFRLDDALIRSALGSRPEEVYYEWNPLYQMSEKEAAEVEKTFAEAATSLVSSGLVPDVVMMEMVKGGIVERGQWPGAETAYEEAGDLAEASDPPEDDEPPEDEDGTERLDANDAAPRTLYVRRDLLNANDVIAWAKAQGFTSTLAADDMHVTVLYSRQQVDWMKMGETWSGDGNGNLTIKPGGARLVEKLGPNAVVLLFNSSELTWRHIDMIRSGASSDYPDYQPHVTISYTGAPTDLGSVEPYRGELRFGPEVFEELNEDWKSGVVEA